MEFILSLAHFCEVHGPKAVLCTQAWPTPCAQCDPPSPFLTSQKSNNSFDTEAPTARQSPSGSTDYSQLASSSFVGNLSRSSTAVEWTPPTPALVQSPQLTSRNGRPTAYAGRENDTCASCSYTVPGEYTKGLPAGAPGSPRSGSPGFNGSPVLRCRLLDPSCVLNDFYSSAFDRQDIEPCSHEGHQSDSSGASSSSIRSSSSQEDVDNHCHPHETTFVTLSAPRDPTEYALLRAAVVRTLSSESLPRGLSSGSFVVGDESSHIIAYMFRLPDPRARGRRRSYAFIALGGPDGQRALKASSRIIPWFTRMADCLISQAEHFQEEQRREEEREIESESQDRRYTPVSSFLTQRGLDANGMPRRAGQTLPRSLADITGNPNVFASVHLQFVRLLRSLGHTYGMLPKDESLSCEPFTKDEAGHHHTASSQANDSSVRGLGLQAARAVPSAEIDKLRDLDTTPTPAMSKINLEASLAKMKVSSLGESENSQKSNSDSKSAPCSSLTIESPRRQVMV